MEAVIKETAETMRSVLVTRPQPVADEFAEKLRHAGFFAYVAPMLEYVEVETAPDAVEGYQALIFTSVQAVQIFSRHSQERQLAVLAIGDATAQAASRAGFDRVYSAAGDSSDIAALIQDKAAPLALKKILHLCSEDTPQDIGRAAARIGIEVVQRQVYKAKFIERFPDDVMRALQHHTIDTVTLFSARTAANIVHLMRQKDLRGVSAKLEAVCISARVAEELREIPWRVVRVASRPDMESMLEILKSREDASQAERRKRAERRQTLPLRDARGYIRDSAYDGPERRTGLDRRAYQKLQQERVMREKMNFLNGVVISAALIFIAIVLAGVLLMGPEYARLGLGGGANSPPSSEENGGARSFWGMLNSGIEKIQAASKEEVAEEIFQWFSQMPGRASAMRRTAAGDAAVERSLRSMRTLLAEAPDNLEALNEKLQVARRRDLVLNALLGRVGLKDLAAAALLLTLSEFRSNVSNHRPYAEDLALLQKFAGNDPEVDLALQRLSPYAEKGILGREALEEEFNGFASDIVAAATQGRDISIEKRALQGVRRFSRRVQADETKDHDDDAAAVARARLLLHQGDVKSAMRELQALDGDAALAAKPWMDSAAGYVTADQSSDALTRGILQDMPAAAGFSAEDIFLALKESMRSRDVSYISPALKKGDNGYSGVLTPATP